MKWSNFTNFKVKNEKKKEKKNFHSIDISVRKYTKLTTLNERVEGHPILFGG